MKNLDKVFTKLTSIKLLITGAIYAFLYFMPLFGYDHRLTDRGLILVSAGFAGIIWMFADKHFIRRELEAAAKENSGTIQDSSNNQPTLASTESDASPK